MPIEAGRSGISAVPQANTSIDAAQPAITLGCLHHRLRARGVGRVARDQRLVRGDRCATSVPEAFECSFEVRDCFEFLSRVKDALGHGLYCDPPFPGPGDQYRHRFSVQQHRELARRLGGLRATRVVCRFYEHELIAELYPEGQWIWRRLAGGKKQTNAAAPEVLLINGPSRASLSPPPAGPMLRTGTKENR